MTEAELEYWLNFVIDEQEESENDSCQNITQAKS